MTKREPMDVLIYGDLVKAVDGICKRVFIERRPKVLSEETKDFLVIQIPTETRGLVAGDFNFVQNGYGAISIFTKAKTDGTLNVNTHGRLVQNVVDLFPINGDHARMNIVGKRHWSEDGYGFQYTEIYFDLRTKVNANKKID